MILSNNRKVFCIKCYFSKIISFQKGKVVLAVAEPYVHHWHDRTLKHSHQNIIDFG